MWTFNRFILKQVFTLSFVICLHIQWTVWVEKCNYENCIRKNIVRFITTFAVLEISLFWRYMVSSNTVCQKWKISAKKNISVIKNFFALKSFFSSMSIMSELLIFHILKLFMSNVRDIEWRLTQKARRTCKVRGSLEILFSSCACAYVQKHLYDNCRLKNGSIPLWPFCPAMKSKHHHPKMCG